MQVISDGREHLIRDVIASLDSHFQLSDAERSELLPSGRDTLFRNRIGWARTYLKKALLIDSPRRGVWRITPRGSSVLAEGHNSIDVKFLTRFPEFVEFQKADSSDAETASASEPIPSGATPEEAIEAAYKGLRAELGDELLSRILSASPDFFERLVVELLVKMGYGGSRRDAGEKIGRSGDEGIDGVIKEDRLGLDTIYIQAKRWKVDNIIGRPEIQKFVGALQGQRARKGVFITTSSFTSDAKEYTERIDTKVVLIDGRQLVSLMMDFDVGVSIAATYLVKKIDSDYFEES